MKENSKSKILTGMLVTVFAAGRSVTFSAIGYAFLALAVLYQGIGCGFYNCRSSVPSRKADSMAGGRSDSGALKSATRNEV